MMRQDKDLILILIIAIVNMVWSYLPTHFVVVSVVLALPLVFLAPGYLLIELLSQKREQDGTKQFLLSIGLSLSIDILGGFLLNIIPVGLTTLTWSLFLGILSTAGALLCMVKRLQRQIYVDQKHRDLPTRYQFLLLVLAIYVVIFAFMYANNTIADQQHRPFTQFWLHLDTHTSHICTIQLGIASSEAVTTTYQVEMKENNQYATQWSLITLAPQQKWQREIPIAINSGQNIRLQIEADLSRQQEPGSVYRTAQVLLASSKSTCAQDASFSRLGLAHQ